MALFDIEFEHTEIYRHTETIEAESLEQANEIANKLLGSVDFQADLTESIYYDHEDKFLYAYEVEEGDGKFQRHATMSADVISSYLED